MWPYRITVMMVIISVLALILLNPFTHVSLTIGYFIWWVIFPVAILLFCVIMFYFFGPTSLAYTRQKKKRKKKEMVAR